MPSKTEKQRRFMAACANGAGYDKCPPRKVSKEFFNADRVKARAAALRKR